jgi:hypothetical protein
MGNSKIRKELNKEIGAIRASLIAVVLAAIIIIAIVMKALWDIASQSTSSIDLPTLFFVGLFALPFIFGGSSDSSSGEFCDGGLEYGVDYSDAGIGY